MAFMSTLGDKIKQLRKQLNMSQSELADKVGLSYAQIGRYETKGAQPPAEALRKIADTLGVTPDYLINGSADEKAQNKLSDTDLINQFKAVEQLNEDDKMVVKKLIDAFLLKANIQKSFIKA
jgi:transcriptional regulator with XRE-family HTH domain